LTPISDYTAFANGQISLTLWKENTVNNYAMDYAFFGYLRGLYGAGIYKDIYNLTGNKTQDIDSVLSLKTPSGFDANVEKFIWALRYSQGSFPSNFFLSGFNVQTCTLNDTNIKPYAFLYKNPGGFTNINPLLKYLDATGAETTDKAAATSVVWLDNTAWGYNLETAWLGAGTSQQNTYSASILQSENLAAQSGVTESITNRSPLPIDRVISIHDKTRFKFKEDNEH
jgi:hypothetical protein